MSNCQHGNWYMFYETGQISRFLRRCVYTFDLCISPLEICAPSMNSSAGNTLKT
jgi:hypothetical protein